MKAFIGIESKRAVRSLSFWCALALGMFLALAQYFDEVVEVAEYLDVIVEKNVMCGTLVPHSVFNNWIGGESYTVWHYVFFMILPILSVLPFSTSLYMDRKTGLIQHFFVRGKRKNYYIAKYIVTFMTGGIVVTVPLIVNLLLSLVSLPDLLPEAASGLNAIDGSAMWAEIFFTHPYIYILRYIILIFIFSGCIAGMSLTLGFVTDNIFTILCIPFVIHLFLYCVMNTEETLKYVPANFLDPAQLEGFTDFGVVCVFIIIMIIINVVGVIMGVHDETI